MERGKEDEKVEREDKMADCNNTGQGQGRTGKTQNMSQATFSQPNYTTYVCTV